jgi:helix-turn-helix, Psq domain/Tc5 transposase DNA-binding domain
MLVQTQEARIILAIKAICTTKKLSRLCAARIYNVPYSTLTDRMNGCTVRAELQPPTKKLTQLEEESLSLYILDLDSRGFAPWLASVEDMANYLLETRREKRVGKLWAHRFVQRRLELKTRFNRVYDFQRAL